MTTRKRNLDQGFTVGSWQALPATGELFCDDQRQRLEPKVMQLLALLAARAPNMVERDEIEAALWPDIVVGEDALARCLLKLRRALGDDAREPRYIETLPRRGYRLIAPFEPLRSEPRSPTRRPFRWWAAAAVLATVIAAAAIISSRPSADGELPLLARAHDHYYRFEQADNERAHLLYQRVLEETPGTSDALAGLANTLAQRVIRWPEVGGPVPEHVRSLAAALNSDRLATPWARATLERARELVDTAVRNDPASGFAWKAHGLIAALQRDLQAARDSYRTALNVDRSSWEAAVNLGELHLIENDEAGAVPHFVRAYRIMDGQYSTEAQRVGPWQPQVGVLIGDLFRDLGDIAQAEEWFRRVLASTPLHVDATLALAAARAEAGDRSEAETLCRDLVSRIGPLQDCIPYLPDR